MPAGNLFLLHKADDTIKVKNPPKKVLKVNTDIIPLNYEKKKISKIEDGILWIWNGDEEKKEEVKTDD